MSDPKPQIGVIIGTRPEAIKLIPVIRELKKRSLQVGVTVILSGQHRELVHPLLEDNKIAVDLTTNLLPRPRSLAELTSELLLELEQVFNNCALQALIVQGDTTSAFVGALVSFYHKTPVAHVEAGLRSGNINTPFPEELNRSLISKVARWHFAPTASARANLLREGIAEKNISVVGNTVVDAIQFEVARAKQDTQRHQQAAQKFTLPAGKKIVFVTGHRRENFGAGMHDIFGAIKALADRADVFIVTATHPNPNAHEPAERLLGNHPHVRLVPPLSYSETIYLLSRANLLITDSGGLQEEAPSFGLPTLITRSVTERTEALAPGRVELVGCDRDLLLKRAHFLLDHPPPRNSNNPFGDGQSAPRISDKLCTDLCYP